MFDGHSPLILACTGACVAILAVPTHAAAQSGACCTPIGGNTCFNLSEVACESFPHFGYYGGDNSACGSSGPFDSAADCISAIVPPPAPAAPVALSVRVLLEGPYSTSANMMGTTLLGNGDLPLDQPFSDAAYDGTVLNADTAVAVVSHADSTVEWLLASLRTGPAAGTEVPGTRQPVVVYEHGTVASAGEDSLHFAAVSTGDYYIVLRSRNHLDVMSASPVSVSGGVGSYDFTAALTQAFNSGHKELETGVFGMASADGTIDGQVTASDFNDWLVATKAGLTGYEQSDFNCDGQVTVSDFNLWLANTKAAYSSQVP